jgi:hypothetical protein
MQSSLANTGSLQSEKEGSPKKDVEILRQNLGELPEAMVEPPFIMVSGLPGSGKSYFCRQLSQKIPLLILETDKLRKQLFHPLTYTARENFRLFQACHQLIEELLRKGIPLAFDATNLEERHRERLYHIAEQTGAKLIIVRVKASPEVISQRLGMRSEGNNPEDHSSADEMVYQRMKFKVERITRHHFTVDTSTDIAPQLAKIIREVNR